MWSRRRLLAAGAAALSLAGCGFAPVYGPGGEGVALRGTIRPVEPRTDMTFTFVRRFEERLGRPETPRYDLIYTLATERAALAIDRSDDITRLNIEGRLDWRLIPVGGGAPILTGSESAFTSYSAPTSTIATLAARQDAERRLAIILADDVVTRLLGSASALAQ